MRAARLALLALAWVGAAFAHPAPSSIVRLDFRADGVRAEYWLPVSELEYARAADPGGALPAYLLRHVAAQTPAGAAWRIDVGAVRETKYLDHPYLVADLVLTPPPGASPREFLLLDDAVTHEVRNHVVYVAARRGEESAVLGVLQYPARRLRIAAPAGS
ncbi:MAG TPA: hypothetical protein VMF52_11795 [Steroidobacteraceae bacterium]|nr:hypothetical protein [Steroidobacteraceae bacterium]